MNWMFAGTGWMAKQMAQSLAEFVDEKIIAASSRRYNPLKDFAEEFDISIIHTDREIILEKCKPQILYISTPHSSHHEWIEWGLENHMHVLVEKPGCLSSKKWAELSALAHKKERCLMEARWTLFFPAIQFLRDEFQSGRLGSLIHIESTFCIQVDHDPTHRLWDPQLGGGALWDLGVYNLTLIQCFFSLDKLALKSKKVVMSVEGVDQYLEVEYLLPGGGSAKIKCGTDRSLPQVAHIEFGTTHATLNNFFHPNEIQWRKGLQKKTEEFETKNPGYQFEVAAFLKAIHQKDVEVGQCNHRWTKELLEMCEEIIAFDSKETV